MRTSARSHVARKIWLLAAKRAVKPFTAKLMHMEGSREPSILTSDASDVNHSRHNLTHVSIQSPILL
jgi:hypothetical protein